MIGLSLTIPSLLAPKLVDKYTTGPKPFSLVVRGTIPRLLLVVCSALLYRLAPSRLRPTRLGMLLSGYFLWPTLS